jgi:hypothetical protein
MILLYGSASLSSLAQVNESSAFWSPNWLFGALDRIVHDRAHVSIVAGPATMSVLAWSWKIALLLACIGLFTRLSTIVAFVLGVYFIGLSNNFGKVESELLPPVFVLGILALSRCGDALSIDAIWRSRRGSREIQPSGEYRWPIRAVWVVMSLMFFGAGVAKLRASGLSWAFGGGFSVLLIKSYYDPNPPLTRLGLWIANHILIASLFALGSLMIETLFPLALFNRWARILFPAAAFGMQFGIGIIMNIWFIHFLPAYIFWVPWDRIATRFAPRSAAPTQFEAELNEPRL